MRVAKGEAGNGEERERAEEGQSCHERILSYLVI
jgi:hypothetical protein